MSRDHDDETTSGSPTVPGSGAVISELPVSEAADLADRGDLDADVYRELARRRDEGVRYNLLGNPAAPLDVLVPRWDDSIEVRGSLAANTSVDADVLIGLAADDAFDVRSTAQYECEMRGIELPWSERALAANPERLEKMVVAPQFTIREAVAASEHVTPELLECLDDDYCKYVVNVVACNPKTPPESLRTISKYADFDARSFVVVNPNLPLDAIESLSEETDSRIAEKAAQRLSYLAAGDASPQL